MTLSIDYRDIHGGNWELYENTPEYRRWRMEIEPGKFIVRTDFLAHDDLIQTNQDSFNGSIGKRWGDGQVAARIPMNVFFQKLAPHIKSGDKEHLKWFLNRDEAKPWRTFKGHV